MPQNKKFVVVSYLEDNKCGCWSFELRFARSRRLAINAAQLAAPKKYAARHAAFTVSDIESLARQAKSERNEKSCMGVHLSVIFDKKERRPHAAK